MQPPKGTEREPDTLGGVTRDCQRKLVAAGVESPARDARLLVAAALGLEAVDLLAKPERRVTKAEQRSIDMVIERRCAREPVSRILRTRAFFGRPFALSPATLDPRPDSETLIEMALEIADKQGWRQRAIRILDVGTGSGCLLATLLAELPLAAGVATDVSLAALETARRNAESCGVGERASFMQADALDGVAGLFDLVVCNPPYIPTADIATLAPEVRDYDPPGALDGGADGLDIYRRVIPDLGRVAPSGWVAFEVGAGQAGAVAELLLQRFGRTGSGEVRFRTDLGGHTRCVAMQLQL
jgi:release factor glutamine methyltransferase